MTRVRNRHVSAIGGWQFYEPTMNKKYEGWDFGTVASQIREGRLANPRFNLNTDQSAIELELDERNALRMLKIPGGENYVVTDGDLSPKTPLLSPSQKLRAAVAGASVLIEWITSGAESVSQDVANGRAFICSKCPLNEQGDWTAKFTVPVSNAIRKALNQRAEWKLSTPIDAQLGVCSACLCPLPLKIQVPIKNITSRISKGSYERLDNNCWIRKENQQTTP